MFSKSFNFIKLDTKQQQNTYIKWKIICDSRIKLKISLNT